ncbi:MAG TPA: BON domain-containing protein [Bryobacteraceae bacterium]|nr:BON domain-containing protein [Bryobacteraceae bacterium]
MTTDRTTHNILRPDDDIAREIRHAFKLDNDVPDERIRVRVDSGAVTLEGTVDAMVQKETAEALARRSHGVIGVINKIDVEPVTAGSAQI